MTYSLFAIYDKKTKTYDKPFSARHVQDVLRDWENLIKEPQNKYGKNPEDFDIYKIADFEDETGECISNKPTFLSSAYREKMLNTQ